MANTDTNPHIRANHSPLNTLAMQALTEYGDFNPGTVDGEVMLMFIRFANRVIDDIHKHPYYNGTGIDYYQSATDARPVKDSIIIDGLKNYYALQQASDKVKIFTPQYLSTLNGDLWFSINGNTKIQMRVMDDGTNKRNINGGKTSETSGIVS